MPNVKLLDKTKPKIKIEYVILRREVRQTKDEKRGGEWMEGKHLALKINNYHHVKYVEDYLKT